VVVSFDSIPHAKLLAVVAERSVDGGILALLKQGLKAPVIGEDENGKRKTVGGGKANSRGTPQGGVISPLLANAYLHILDRIWERHRLKDKLGAHRVRYADDCVVLCKKGVDEPLKVVRQVLGRLDLSRNETKTHSVDATDTSFDFLGFTLQRRRGAKTGKPYPNVRPSDKSVKKIKTRLTALTQRGRTGVPLEYVVSKVNRSLRGWVNYFHHRNSSSAMGKVRHQAEARLRTHWQKRHQGKDRGTAFKRFRSASLYERYGLYKPPTETGWKTAHASV
jgi:RNA-directed DNA polymerase